MYKCTYIFGHIGQLTIENQSYQQIIFYGIEISFKCWIFGLPKKYTTYIHIHLSIYLCARAHTHTQKSTYASNKRATDGTNIYSYTNTLKLKILLKLVERFENV